eukprot:symbB.v1.2.015471.t1/scaffold1156.1/size134879/1
MALALVDRPKEKQRKQFLLGLTDISCEAKKRALALATSQDEEDIDEPLRRLRRSILDWRAYLSPDSDFEPEAGQIADHAAEASNSTSSTAGRSADSEVPFTLCRSFYAWRLLTFDSLLGERLSKALCSMRNKQLDRQEWLQTFFAWRHATLRSEAIRGFLEASECSRSRELKTQVLGAVFLSWSREAQVACRRRQQVNAQQELVPSFLLATTLAAWRRATLRSEAIRGFLEASECSRSRELKTQVLGAVFLSWSREAQVACRRRQQVNAQQAAIIFFKM